MFLSPPLSQIDLHSENHVFQLCSQITLINIVILSNILTCLWNTKRSNHNFRLCKLGENNPPKTRHIKQLSIKQGHTRVDHESLSLQRLSNRCPNTWLIITMSTRITSQSLIFLDRHVDVHPKSVPVTTPTKPYGPQFSLGQLLISIIFCQYIFCVRRTTVFVRSGLE